HVPPLLPCRRIRCAQPRQSPLHSRPCSSPPSLSTFNLELLTSASPVFQSHSLCISPPRRFLSAWNVQTCQRANVPVFRSLSLTHYLGAPPPARPRAGILFSLLAPGPGSRSDVLTFRLSHA